MYNRDALRSDAMRSFRNKLIGFGVPVLFLPLMDMSLSQLPDYIRGLEPDFRRFVAEFIIQQLSGIAQALIVSITRLLFGGIGG
jgi:hypothetical protein